MEPDGIRNGSNTKERMTSTKRSTGKNDREYSTSVAHTTDLLPPSPLRREATLSTAIITPVSSVRATRINARFILKSVFSLIDAQDCQKCFLRNFNGSYLFHTALAGLLLLQQLAFSRYITTVTFSRDVFA